MVIQRVSSATMSREVLYIGSAVPLETSEGLEAVQQPLRSRYPIDNEENIQGILSTLTILPSGIQLKYKADPSHVVLFPFSALTMCAAVRCVKTTSAATGEISARFVSLSSPEAGGVNSERPAIFTAITRRTKGRQVLECHGFITMTPKDALELVQWTSSMDKRSKQGGYSTMTTAMNTSTYDMSRGDTSFRAETSSLPDFPIQLIPGEPMLPNTGPAFYREPPVNGYFYSTKNAQVKKYSLEKFSGNTGVDDTPSVIAPGADHFQRSPGYAASHYSASAAVYPTQPRPPVMVPLRPYMPPPPPPATLVRPVLVRPPPPVYARPPPPVYAYARPRFFSPPPPPMMRARPVPVFVPGPPGAAYYDEEVAWRNRRRGSRGSSRSSSGSSSPHSPGINGKADKNHKKGQGHTNHDESSESSSRPRTPPTDYDGPRGPRVSRRDDYYMRQTQLSGSPRTAPKKGYRGYYMMPPYGYYGIPPGPGGERPRSVPPYGERTASKGKEKKSKKNKKGRKKSSKKHRYGDPYDESTDSVGYMSEFANTADNRQPRDFRRLENQFKHERAFSKSLAEETRNSVRGDGAHNAYSLNQTAAGANEHDFPQMY